LTIEQDVVARLRAAAESLPVPDSPLEPVVRAGVHRTVARIVALVATFALVAAGAAFAIASLSGLRSDHGRRPAVGSTSGGVEHVIRTFYGARVPVPVEWMALEPPVPGGQELMVRGTGSINASVDVRVENSTCVGPCAPLPDPLRPSDFRVVRKDFHGAPLHEAVGSDPEGRILTVTYWIGPDSSESTRAATEFIIRNLHLPQPQLDPADVHRANVPGPQAGDATRDATLYLVAHLHLPTPHGSGATPGPTSP
jgi:hypothetical protein